MTNYKQVFKQAYDSGEKSVNIEVYSENEKSDVQSEAFSFQKETGIKSTVIFDFFGLADNQSKMADKDNPATVTVKFE